MNKLFDFLVYFFDLWYIPIILVILIRDIFYSWFLKKKVVSVEKEAKEEMEESGIGLAALSDEQQKSKLNKIGRRILTERLFFQYFLCLVFAMIISIFCPVNFNLTLLAVMIIGFFNFWSARSSWIATQYELSARSFFCFLDDLIAVILGLIILKEAQYINMYIGTGIIICLIAAILFAVNNYLKEKRGEGEKKRTCLPWRFFCHVLTYCLLWGVISFSMRYFNLLNINVVEFVVGFYSGSFISALILFIYSKQKGAANEFKRIINKKDSSIMFVSSIIVILNCLVFYQSFKAAPILVVKPIFFVTAMIFPALVGLYIVGERKHYDKKDAFLFVIAIIGALAIGWGYSI